MHTEYSEKIDKEIHKEVNREGKRLSKILGFSFEKIIFNTRKKNLALQKIGELPDDFQKIPKRIAKEIYQKDLPEVTIYINTTPFSTWNTEKKYISLSVDRFPDATLSSFCHEINHYLFDLFFCVAKYEKTETKEILTILNESFGIQDHGWKKFSKEREKALVYFQKNHDIQKTVSFVQRILRKRTS